MGYARISSKNKSINQYPCHPLKHRLSFDPRCDVVRLLVSFVLICAHSV